MCMGDAKLSMSFFLQSFIHVWESVGLLNLCRAHGCDTSSPCLIVGLPNVYISMYSSMNGTFHVHTVVK